MISLVYADPFMSYPGTRAKAMGGAFCGIADDASAVWYNPAGVAAGESFDFVVDWMESISQDTETKGDKLDNSQYGVDPQTLDNEETKLFVAIKWSHSFGRKIVRNVKKSKAGAKVDWGESLRVKEKVSNGYALYYISPYTIDWYYPPKYQLDKTFGNFREDMNIYGFAMAFSSHNDRIKYGFTAEYLNIKYDTDDLYLVNDKDINYYYYEKIETDYNHAYGFSGSLGILGILYNNDRHSFRVKLGATYRFGSSCSADTGDAKNEEERAAINISEVISDQMVFSKPSSYDIGFSLSKSFTSLRSAFLFAGQYGETDWSQSNDSIDNKYTKTSLGAEWQIASKNDFRFAFRAGMYTSEASKPDQGWPDVSGLTFGIGTLIYENFGVDCTYEFRNISFEGTDTEDISLLALSLTMTSF
jgi:hypothetical protein